MKLQAPRETHHTQVKDMVAEHFYQMLIQKLLQLQQLNLLLVQIQVHIMEPVEAMHPEPLMMHGFVQVIDN